MTIDMALGKHIEPSRREESTMRLFSLRHHKGSLCLWQLSGGSEDDAGELRRGEVATSPPDRHEFVAFAKQIEPNLRRALVAYFGVERGLDAAVDALEWAWEHWDKITAARNPGGYLYRVAKRRAIRAWRRPLPTLRFDPPATDDTPWVEPGLERALNQLSPMQRVCLVLVEGYGLTHRETADLLGVGRSTVQKHLERGLARVRRQMGVKIDV